jgi:hypothetical protein
VHNDPSQTLLVTSGIHMYEITTAKYPPGSPTTIVHIESEVSTGFVGTEIGRIGNHNLQETRSRLNSGSCSPSLELSLRPYEITELEK